VDPEIFVDASAWYPIALQKHPDHARVSSVLRARVRARQRIVTTNLVLAEAHALLTTRVGPAIAAAFLRAAWSRPNEVVTSTKQLEDEALEEWIERYDDQRFSLADAVSFVVMKERGIRDALTLDKQFAIAGFVMLP
jgi:predicted nucleic acid-binding protein